MYSTVHGEQESRVEDSGFLWVGVFIGAAAVVNVVITTIHLTFHYPLTLSALWWFYLGTLIWAGIALILISVFASQKMPDAGKTGTQLRSRHYAASMMLSEQFVMYTAFGFSFYAAFYHNQPDTYAFKDYGSDTWLEDVDALKFGLFLWTAFGVSLGGAVATLAAFIQWVKSEVFPDTKPRAGPS